jgi:hypothetical protein
MMAGTALPGAPSGFFSIKPIVADLVGEEMQNKEENRRNLLKCCRIVG